MTCDSTLIRSKHFLHIFIPNIMPFKSTYTQEEKLAAVAEDFLHHNSKKTEAVTGIPARTIRSWRKTGWWSDETSALKLRLQDKLDGKLTGVITKMVDELIDRIKHGDEVLSKDGTALRKKMTGRDIANSLGIIMDRRATIRGDPTRITQTSATERIDNLEAAFDKRGKLQQEAMNKDEQTVH